MHSSNYPQMYNSGYPQSYNSAPTRKKQGLSDCGQCIRYLLITGNVFFWMVSCAVLGVGVWIIIDNNYMSIIYGNVLMTVGAYLIVVAGGVMFLVTGCGCIGAVAQHKIILLIYFCFMVFIAVFLFIGAILAIVYRTEIRNELQYTVMRGSIQKEYGVNFDENPYNEVITWAWDSAQQELRCCSVEDQSWGVYKSSEWYKIQPGQQDYDKPYVPESCCVRDQYGQYINLNKCQTWNQGPPGRQGGDFNSAIYYRGCYGAGRDFIMDFSGALIGIGIGVCACVVVGIVLAFMLFRMI